MKKIMKRKTVNESNLKRKKRNHSAKGLCFALTFSLLLGSTVSFSSLVYADETSSTNEEKMESETSQTEIDVNAEIPKDDSVENEDALQSQSDDETLSTLSESVKIGYVYVSYLNVRSGPGTTNSVLGNVSYTYVIIDGSKKDSDGDVWYKIEYGDGVGYVYSGYVNKVNTITYSNNSFTAFPASYQKYLAIISYIYPNVTFKADNINYTLKESAKAQVGSKVTSSSNGYVAVSYDVIYKYMNPLYYLSSLNIFPFVKQTYNSSQNAAGLKNLFSVNPETFLNTDENIEALLTAGKNNGINPYVLASTILIEKGWMAQDDNPDVQGRQVWTGTVNANSVAVRSGAGSSFSKVSTVNKGSIYIIGSQTNSSGNKWYQVLYDKQYIGYVYSKYISNVTKKCKVYNLFSVNQSDDNPVGGGIYWALKEGWTTLAKSIVGGAEFYKDGYIDNEQDTYYYKDFNVIHDMSEWWHQYAGGITDVEASSVNLACAYKGNTSAKLTLRIPVYESSDTVTSLSTPQINKVYVGKTGVIVKWDAVYGASKYRVFRKTSDGDWEKLGDTTSTSFVDTTASDNVAYRYTVRCLSSDGKTYLSSYEKPGIPITKVATPVLKKVSVISKGTKVIWKAVKGASKYRVFRKTKSSKWKALTDTTSTYYVDKTAKPNTTYTYTVRCLDSTSTVYTSYFESGVQINFLKAPVISKAKIVSKGIKLTWTASKKAVMYRIFRKTDGGKWVKLADTSKLKYIDKTAKKGHTYKYTVRCINKTKTKYTSGFNSGVTITR